MKSLIFKFAFLFGFLSLSACSSTLKKEELGKVKSVAVIGIGVEQQKPVSADDLIGMAMGHEQDTSPEYSLRNESEHIEKIYNNTVKNIKTNTGWNVLSMEKVRRDPAYRFYFQKKTSGMQNRPPVHHRYTYYQAKGILDDFEVFTTSEEDLNKIKDSLGVDALVVVRLKVNLNNSSMISNLVGKGSISPSSQATVVIFDNGKNKIFSESIVGEKIEDSGKHFLGLAEDKKVNELSIKASDDSVAKVFKQLNEKAL